MATKDPQIMVPRTLNLELERNPIAIWQYQSQYHQTLKPAKTAVLLSGPDNREPGVKYAKSLEVASNTDQQSSFTPPSSTHSSSSSSSLPRAKVKIPSKDLYQDVKTSSTDSSPLVTQDSGNPHIDSFNAAKLRYQQEKLTDQPATQKFDQGAGSRLQLDNMYTTSSPTAARRQGPQPTSHLSQQSALNSYRLEASRGNTASSFFSRPGEQHDRANGTSSSLSYALPNNRQGRPYSRPSAGQINYSTGTALHSNEDWRNWVELGVKVFDLPSDTTTGDLWKRFSQEGTVVYIDIYENTKGQPDGKACVRFSPPPTIAFWTRRKIDIFLHNHGTVMVSLQRDQQRRNFTHPSPVDKNMRYPELMIMHAESLDFGVMHDPTTMMDMCHVLPTPKTSIQFRQDMLHREIKVEFQMQIKDPRQAQRNAVSNGLGQYNRTENFQFRIPFPQLEVIRQIESQDNKLILLISLETPPACFKQLDPLSSHDSQARSWGGNDAWYRQTDIAYDPHYLKKSPLALKKLRPLIDIGRWTTYRFMFDMSKNSMPRYNLMRQALRDYNIDIAPFPGFNMTGQRQPSVWEILDKPLTTRRKTMHGLDELTQEIGLAFQVRYQLEVCISQGLLNEHNLHRPFVTRLNQMRNGEARDILEYVANHGKRVFDPMTLFNIKVGDGSALRAKVPHYCVYIRSATVTPTTVYIETPIAETSNRVLRKYANNADRFLRVRFTDEKSEGKIYSTDKDTMNEVFTRVKRILGNGIVIGDRKYEYLACGNAQFREHGAYFFAPSPSLSTEKIRRWMGSFEEIQTVPLYASRIGQCFSTTRAIHGASATLVEIPDIVRNGFKFTDGVGRISSFLATLAASELGISHHSPEPPSVFQIRVGGCKGILAVSTTCGPQEIHIRETQYKFPALHEGLEIIRWSQFTCANLNRQLILILSALGVPDHVFSQKLQLQLSKLEQAMTDQTVALNILQRDIDHNQMTLAVASMVLDGFQETEEPFMMSLLQLWRAWSIKYLKEKTRITIGNGALLLGCVDETATLRGHFNDTPRPQDDAPIGEKASLVPQVFVQISNAPDGKAEVILGPMLLARNPSLHPGDVRVVCGVDVPELHHLKDVVVLPQTGDRDVAGMCSGGDLDGDDFLVIWDQDLLPREWNYEPMDYTPPQKIKHGKTIDIDDLTTFFVTYMKNDTLPRIAQAHLANADYLDEGVKDEKCLKLAALHSLAVDFVKTGQPAQMTKDLKAPKRPHFMDCTHFPADKTYVSKKVLGQLYDQVERIDFVPQFAAPFDERILKAYDIDESMLGDVREIKQEYDAHIRRIMAQHKISTEFEVWSTFVLQHDRTTNDFKFHEQIGQLSNALKDQFRALCRQKAGGKDFQRLGRFVAAMYQCTAMEMIQAVQECGQFEDIGGRSKPLRTMTPEKMPLMSFPWLFPDILGKIAKNGDWEDDGLAEAEHEAAELRQDVLRLHRLRTEEHKMDLIDTSDDLHTAAGVTHRGEVLELFDHTAKSRRSDTAFTQESKQSPSTFAHSHESSINEETLGSPSFNENDLVDLAPPGSFNVDSDNLRSMSFSSHGSDLASLNRGLYDSADEETSGSNLEALRRSFSNSSGESNGADDLQDSRLCGSIPSETENIDTPGVTSFEAAEVIEKKETSIERQEKEEGKEGETEEAIIDQASDDSEDEHEVVISLNSNTWLLNRLARLGADEDPKPALHNVEARLTDFRSSFADYGVKNAQLSGSGVVLNDPQLSSEDAMGHE